VAREGLNSLEHVVVCGGTTLEWLHTSPAAWTAQLSMLSDIVARAGCRWLTVIAHHDDAPAADTPRVREETCAAVVAGYGGERVGDKVVAVGHGGVTVVVDTCAEGRERIATASRRLARAGVVDESQLAAAVLAPIPADPDLVVVLGPATQLPGSLVWELAYSELVFLDVAWTDVNAEHVEMAIDDFLRRDRRFGGIDS
jgi:undecaprenyl diphosphate synthase